MVINMTDIFGANWKSNPQTIDEAKALLDSYAAEGLTELVDKEILVFMPYIFVPELSKYMTEKGYNFRLGAQNVSEHECGAFSGQVAASMLASIGVTEFLIGHSERRAGYEDKVIHGQNILEGKIIQSGSQIDTSIIKAARAEAIEYINEMLNRKILAVVDHNKKYWEKRDDDSALQHPLTAIYCVGETLEEKEAGKTLNILGRQLAKGLENVPLSDYAYVIIAYEPRWAIGSGNSASSEDIKEAHKTIRSLTRKDMKILYGGSMKPETAAEIMAIEGVDGGLIGGASLSGKDFSRVVKYDAKK